MCVIISPHILLVGISLGCLGRSKTALGYYSGFLLAKCAFLALLHLAACVGLVFWGLGVFGASRQYHGGDADD